MTYSDLISARSALREIRDHDFDDHRRAMKYYEALDRIDRALKPIEEANRDWKARYHVTTGSDLRELSEAARRAYDAMHDAEATIPDGTVLVEGDLAGVPIKPRHIAAMVTAGILKLDQAKQAKK